MTTGGMSSYISADDLVDGSIFFMVKGKRDPDADTVTMKIRIYNYCEGENTSPIDLEKTISVKKGGVVS